MEKEAVRGGGGGGGGGGGRESVEEELRNVGVGTKMSENETYKKRAKIIRMRNIGI